MKQNSLKGHFKGPPASHTEFSRFTGTDVVGLLVAGSGVFGWQVHKTTMNHITQEMIRLLAGNQDL